jgi:molybdate transport system substrate-binding protein
MNRLMPFKLFVLLFVLISPSRSVFAAEINAFFPGAMKAALSELIPQFERGSGHKIATFYGSVGAVVNRLKNEEPADFVVVSDGVLADLILQGRIIEDGHATVAVVGTRLFVRKGATKPDISSADALKTALLSAKSIVYADPALGDSSAIFAKGLLDRLGIATEMKPKTVLVGSSGKVETVVKGDAEMGFDQMSNIALDSRVEPMGALPAEFQNYTRYAGGVVAGSKQQEAVRALIDFLTSAASQIVMKQKGFEAY